MKLLPDYDFSRYFTKKEGQSTAAPLQRRQDARATTSSKQAEISSTTTMKTPQRLTTPKQFVTTKLISTVASTRTPPKTTTQTIRQTTRSTVAPVFAQRLPAFNKNVVVSKKLAAQESTPARDLLPPHEEVKNYDDVTTKGPPIYYEWKVPDRGLLPPKLDNETDVQSKHNTRSIAEEGNFGNDFQSSESRRFGSGSSVKIQYKDLQKLFSIPEFEFPIEASGRDGYENAEAVNSFQVKIPYKTGNSDRYYYLEHAHCNPACHPYFFKPGRCEPCIKL